MASGKLRRSAPFVMTTRHSMDRLDSHGLRGEDSRILRMGWRWGCIFPPLHGGFGLSRIRLSRKMPGQSEGGGLECRGTHHSSDDRIAPQGRALAGASGNSQDPDREMTQSLGGIPESHWPVLASRKRTPRDIRLGNRQSRGAVVYSKKVARPSGGGWLFHQGLGPRNKRQLGLIGPSRSMGASEASAGFREPAPTV